MSWLDLAKRAVRWRYRLIPIQWSYGREFRRYAVFLNETRLYSDEQLRDYVWQRLSALLRFAYDETDYYRSSLTAAGCTPNDIRSFDDFARLPLTNRRIVRENLEQMKPRSFRSTHPIKTTTSGTTGFPLTLYRSAAQEALRKAVVWRHYSDLGYDFKDRRVTLGRPLDFPQEHRYTHLDLLEANLWLNTFHLNPGDFHHIYEAAAEFAPKMIVGHPSSLYAFCLQAEKSNLPPIAIPIVYSYSEKLYPHHIEKFQSFFGGRVFDYYGNRENTLAVARFSCGSYHIQSEFGYVEFVPDNKAAVQVDAGSIVSTALENYSVPLIRYDTGDLGRPLGRCSRCALPHPTMEILGGRGKDVLVTADGFVNCHLDTFLARNGFIAADYIQIYQREIKSVIVRFLPNVHYVPERDRPLLQRLAREGLSNYFEVELEELDKPPFTEAGKMPYVVSELAHVAASRRPADESEST